MKTGIVILAAGNSSRLGKPKQLLTYKGNTLLQHAIQSAASAKIGPVIIVLGAYAEEILVNHQHADVTYTINKNWQEGMSSSLKWGLKEVLNREPNIENVIFTVVDQVFANTTLLTDLLKKQQEGKNIVASRYGKTTGVPVLFNKSYFEELMNLQGHTGAKQLLTKHENDTTTVDFELGHIDIDTETDYQQLIGAQ